MNVKNLDNNNINIIHKIKNSTNINKINNYININNNKNSRFSFKNDILKNLNQQKAVEINIKEKKNEKSKDNLIAQNINNINLDYNIIGSEIKEKTNLELYKKNNSNKNNTNSNTNTNNNTIKNIKKSFNRFLTKSS